MSGQWPHHHARDASRLPELIHGEHVMRRPIDIVLTPDERAEHAKWSRRVLGIWAVVVATVIALPMLHRAVSNDADVYATEVSRDPGCARWDEAARDSLAALVRAKNDADLRQVGDAVFRMRRARRNCHMGWSNLACLDYYAVIHGQASRVDSWPPAAVHCVPPEAGTSRNVVRVETFSR